MNPGLKSRPGRVHSFALNASPRCRPRLESLTMGSDILGGVRRKLTLGVVVMGALMAFATAGQANGYYRAGYYHGGGGYRGGFVGARYRYGYGPRYGGYRFYRPALRYYGAPHS